MIASQTVLHGVCERERESECVYDCKSDCFAW